MLRSESNSGEHAAIASAKRELGATWPPGVVVWQCVLAWLVALLVHGIGAALGGF